MLSCGTLKATMATLFLFSHQLHPAYLSSAKVDLKKDRILFIDSPDQWTHYRFHKQRIILHLSAMRHYVAERQKEGWAITLEQGERLVEVLKRHRDVIAFEPTNRYEQQWLINANVTTRLRDPLFLIPAEEWPKLLPQGKPWKLDPLYRSFRVRFNLLMSHQEPEGGKFTYDTENRRGPDENSSFEPPIWFEPDAITRTAIAEVEKRFFNHPGNTKAFAYPVTREQALKSLDHFIACRLPTFGTYQDAMVEGDPWMSHSLLSGAINLGLLSPMEVLLKAEASYRSNKSPLNAVEGFIRQILGWREYVRGIYLVTGPSYLNENRLDHHRPLPTAFYDGKTDMNCLKRTVEETIDHGYNHHIQRLMVLCNFANLTEVTPQAVNAWFNEMYIDSSEWVVAANVLGMGLYADGGKMSTKPYIASGAYIHKMSNYCDTCAYQVKLKTGEKACPLNSLYWHYIDQKSSKLRSNPRLSMMVKVLEKMPTADKESLIKQAKLHLGKPR